MEGLSFRKGRHGKIVTITGPVKSGKTTHLERLLNSASATIWKPGDSNIILAKHPLDDLDIPGKIGGYPAVETDNPDKIAKLIRPETEAVVISGVNFFTNPHIVDLLQGLAMSNRRVYAAGHNLLWDGKPFNHMPMIMAMSDDFVLPNAPCVVDGCQMDATRSRLKEGNVSKSKSKAKKDQLLLEGGERCCLKHHKYKSRPDHKPFLIDQVGGLELFVGSMYASKTTLWVEKMKELEANGLDYVVFKWLKDTRYGSNGKKKVRKYDTGLIGMNNQKDRIPAILVENAQDIKNYLKARTSRKDINEDVKNREIGHFFIDEGQFMEGLFDVVSDSIYRGYRFYVTGLMRTFTMEPFGDIPDLLTIAERINVLHAYCEDCGREATESQRMIKNGKLWVPASSAAEAVAVGGKEKGKSIKDRYEARCKDCLDVPDMAPLKYDFPRYEPVPFYVNMSGEECGQACDE